MYFFLLTVSLLTLLGCGAPSEKHSEPTPDLPLQDTPHNANKPSQPEARLATPEYLLFELPAANDPSLIKIEDAPAGNYKLAEVSTIHRPLNTNAVVAVRHQLAQPGQTSRAKDQTQSLRKLDNLNNAKKYSFSSEMQLPLSIAVVDGVLSFQNEHYYWQRQDLAEKTVQWFIYEAPIAAHEKATKTDIDFEEAFRTFAQYQNGYYVNDRKLAFSGFFIVGSAGSIAALQQLSTGDLVIYVSYEYDPTYYKDHEKIQKLIRLVFRKQ